MIAPLQANRFRIDLMGNQVIAESTSSFSFDLVNRTIKLDLRESCDCQITPTIMSMLESKSLCLTWNALPARGDDPVGTVMFSGLKIIAHLSKSSYEENERCVGHKLEMTYEKHEFIS
jgi:hypothetical protein